MFSRAARVPQRLPPCRTSLTQHLVHWLASTEAADATTKQKTQTQIPSAPLRTAYIKSWRPVQNITDSWMIIREIEKRYGKVLESHFLKDYEDTGKYQMMTFVVFADPESVERIPETGVDVTISSRPVDKPNHEISLEDMEHLIASNPLTSSAPAEFEEVPAADPQNDSSVLGFRIYRAKLNYMPESATRNWIYQRTGGRVLEQFQAWGGFANLAPLDSPRLMKEQELFAGPGENNQKRMRAALDLCKRNLERYYALSATSSASSIQSSPVNKTPQEPSREPSTTTPIPASASNTSTSTAARTPVAQEPASTPSSEKVKSKSTTAAKSEPPKSAAQPTKSKAAEATATKTPVAKANAASSSKKPLPPKAAAPKAPKPAGQKLPPPVVQHRPTATIPRRLPKPRIQPSKSAPIRSAPTRSEMRTEDKTTTEDKNDLEEPAPAEAPSPLSKLWGLLTGRRG